MSKFGDNLRQIRISRGYTQAEFARLIDSTQATLSSWEISTRVPPMRTIQQLADVLHVPLSSLISISDSENEDDLASEIANAFAYEPKLKVLFTAAKYLNSNDIQILIRVAQAFANERIETGDRT